MSTKKNKAAVAAVGTAVISLLTSIGLAANPAAASSGPWSDFNGDGFADLAIGVPGEDVDGAVDAGAVNVLYGSAGGLSAAGDQVWHQDMPNVEGGVEPGDRFGTSVATGDFNGDGFADLAIGVPGEDVDGAVDAGAVNVLYGSAGGLSAAGDQVWHQDMPNVEGATEPGDVFGTAT